MRNLPHDARALQVAIDAMPVAVSWASLTDQTILFMNREFTKLFGYVVGDFVDIGDWIERAYPLAEDRERAGQAWSRRLDALNGEEHKVDQLEILVRCRNGEIKTVLSSGVLLPETGWALAIFVDITERKLQERRLARALEEAAKNEILFKQLLQHSPEMILLSPFSGAGRYVSPAVAQITGFSEEEYLAMPGMEMIHGQDQALARQIVQELRAGKLHQVFRYRAKQKNGGYRWVEATVSGFYGPSQDRLVGYVATMRDVSAEKAREERIAEEHRELTEVATLDEVTGIPNRRAFNRALERLMDPGAEAPETVSVLMLDVDHFKRYNDAYGHIPGDACLKAIAKAIEGTVRRDADFAARYGGEEFVVLMPKTDTEGASTVATKIMKAIHDLAIPHGSSVCDVVTVSIGVASGVMRTEGDSKQLLERADHALYLAKTSGRNCFRIG